jgi:hypothetical protein
MNECLNPNHLSEQIQQIIKSKNWYVFTGNGEFLWDESVALMAKMISKEIRPIGSPLIKEIIENSFNPESLSKAGSECFIDCLLKIDPELILWSEGDPIWQKLKAANAGLINRPGLRTEFISKDKIIKLREIILSLINKFGEMVDVVVIDDKEKNLAYAASLQDQVASSKITINTFYFNPLDVETNPTACLAFLSQMQRERKGEKIKIITDMDGVLVNTDKVLVETVSQKLAKILER